MVSLGSPLTEMISTRSLFAWYTLSIPGNSLSQGPHQLAKILRTTRSFSFRFPDIVADVPSVRGTVKSGIA